MNNHLFWNCTPCRL